jgi:hypothetical protein
VSCADSDIQGCQLAVSNPIQVGALCEKVAGRLQLAPVAGIPKRVGYIPLRGFHIFLEVFLEAIHESQGRGLPDGGASATLDESACGAPAAEPNGI